MTPSTSNDDTHELAIVSIDLFVHMVHEVTESETPLSPSTPVTDFDSIEMLSIAILVDELGTHLSTDEWQAHITGEATLESLHDLVVRGQVETALG